jgi:hypothetical protein
VRELPSIPYFVDYDDRGNPIHGRTDDVASVRMPAPQLPFPPPDDDVMVRVAPWWCS